MTRAVIDRLGDTTAVLEVEGQGELHVERAWLPADAREGDVLVLTVSQAAGESHVHLRRDDAATDAARAEAEALLRRLRGA